MIRLSVTALAAVCVMCVAALAQPQMARPGPAKTFICPSQVSVKLVSAYPAGLANGGWKANEGSFFVQLDPINPPHFTGGNMVCYYKLGSQPGAFVIYQPVGNMKCSLLSNGSGFSCTL
jgi:hypothetical protein